MSESKSNQADDQAADKALKSVSANFVERLNLFDTTLHLYAMDGLTALEREKLQNIYITELERKHYLMTIVIPSKGPYKGMIMLRQALKETGQNEILDTLEKAYENAVHAIIAEKSEIKHETEANYPIQATTSGRHDGHTTAVCSASGLVCKDSEDDVRNIERAVKSNNSSSSDNEGVSLVEQPPQPQSYDVSLHFPLQPQSDNFDSLLECQPHDQPESDNVLLHSPVQPLSDNVVSLVEQQPVSTTTTSTSELQLQAQSDDVSSHNSLVAMEKQLQLQSDNASSHKSPEQKPQPQTDNVSSHKSPVTMEQQLQLQSDNASSLKSPVVTIEQKPQTQSDDVFSHKSPQSESDDFSSHKSLKQQSQPQSNNATSLASPVTVKQEPQPQSDNGASLDSPTQQQSQSQFTPYFKFRLPPTYSGTVTFAVTPSSYSSADGIPHSSSTNRSEPPEQDVLTATPENINNIDHDHNGAASSVDHDNDILKSIDHFKCDYSVMKFVFVGDTATGKTSLIERYASDMYSDSPKSTIIDFKCVELTCYNTKYQIHLWDTAGQERFRAFTAVYCRDAVGVFVVYDVTRNASLQSCLQWKKEVDDAVYGDPIPVVLIANKIDCGQLDGEQFSKENGFAGYFETSAKTGAGVEKAIHFMVKKVHELYSHQESEVQTPRRDCASNIKLQFNDKRRSRRKCCN